MTTTGSGPQWKCNRCGHRAMHLTTTGTCENCMSDDMTMDLGEDVERVMAAVMKPINVALNEHEAKFLLMAVDKVLMEYQMGRMRIITLDELAVLRELRDAIRGKKGV